jgi:hypothetical protein
LLFFWSFLCLHFRFIWTLGMEVILYSWVCLDLGF